MKYKYSPYITKWTGRGGFLLHKLYHNMQCQNVWSYGSNMKSITITFVANNDTVTHYFHP